MAVIAVEGLTKRFGAKTVVDDLSLTVHAGEIYGFLGPNGSGKTTSIRMLCGLLTPDRGRGTCLGFDVLTQSAEIKREVGYMTQRFALWDDLTVDENLDFIGRMFGVRDRRRAVEATLLDAGLADRRAQLAGTLSGGWKQRLSLAACRLHRPQLLLLDEPTAGVDPHARRVFWEEIHRLSDEGLTVLVSTHYMDEAERCHRLAYLAEGRLVAQGTAREIIDDAKLTTYALESVPTDAVAAIRRLAGVRQVANFGTTLHVAGTDERLLAASLAAFAEAHEIPLERIPTSLEDAFMRLLPERTP